MLPTYQSGDTLLGTGWFRPRVGQVVIAHHGGLPLVKRITKIEGQKVWLEGDNRIASTDSRSFGYVDQSQVVGRVIAAL
jgi:phage repressor protein C with HTH and peptisase S24 domain